MAKDLRGQQIETGDQIAYAIRVNKTAEMGLYTVLGFNGDRIIGKKVIASGFAAEAGNTAHLADRSRAVIVRKWHEAV